MSAAPEMLTYLPWNSIYRLFESRLNLTFKNTFLNKNALKMIIKM
jgi:hypothetical protein